MPKKVIGRIRQREEQEIVYSVREAVDSYLETVGRLSKVTQSGYHSELMLFSAWCRDENVLLHQIDSVVVDTFVEYLRTAHKPHKQGRTELSTYTLAGYVRVIKTFLSWCVLHDDYGKHIKQTTVNRIKRPHIEKVIIETFTVADIDALFDACHKEESEHLQVRDTAILSLLVDSGIRASELCTLTIGNTHLDPKDAYIRIFGKGRKWGEVGLGEQSRLAVGRYLRKFREPTVEYEIEQSHPDLPSHQFKKVVQEALQTAYLFVNRYGGQLTRSGLYRMIDRLGDWAGIEGVRCSPHDFRHYYAKRFMQQGGNIYQLSKILRHSSIRVTEEYLKSLQQSEVRKGAPSILDGLHKEK